MAEVLLFHHAQGRTPGVLSFAETLRQAGYTVHVPDLYEGRTFDDLKAGVAYAEEVGFDTIVRRGELAAEKMAARLVYCGFSLGVLPAQKLAQTRRAAAGALLLHGCILYNEFGDEWPQSVPAQVHAMEADPWFVGGGDLDAARELVASTGQASLFLYPGDRHLFTDASLPEYDVDATALLMQRVLAFLDAIR